MRQRGAERRARLLSRLGRQVPYKVHIRSPSFVHMGGCKRMLEGYQVADVIPTFGSLNMIGGYVDLVKRSLDEFKPRPVQRRFRRDSNRRWCCRCCRACRRITAI